MTRWLRLLLPAFSEANLQKLLSLYPRSSFYNSYFPGGKIKLHAEVYRLDRIYRDKLFTCQPIFIGMTNSLLRSFAADILLTTGQNLAAVGNAVYFYNQNQTMLGPQLKKSGLAGAGPVHESELIYVFGNLTKYDVPGYPYHSRPSDYRLRVQESRSWSSFVSVGQPSLEGHNTLTG